jgi:hypothetical protein
LLVVDFTKKAGKCFGKAKSGGFHEVTAFVESFPAPEDSVQAVNPTHSIARCAAAHNQAQRAQCPSRKLL